MTKIYLRKKNLHIAYVIHTYEMYETPQALLEAYFTVMDWARGLSAEGIEVSIFYRFHTNDFFEKDKLHFYFIKDRLPPNLKPYCLAYHFHKKVANIVKEKKIDLIHAHNPFAVLPNWTLGRLTPQIPMLVQDHSGRNTFKHHWLLKKMLSGIDAIVFAAKGQDIPWTTNGILPEKKCYFVMENSSHFRFEDRAIARQKTKIEGQPVFLWVGNLNANKDPLTVLKAFVKIVKLFPATRLYMIYRFNDLEQQVRDFTQDAKLSEKVKMLGAMKRSELKNYYNSADYMISASYKEGSGYSLIEAMSCGVIPIVTQIPSFKALTGNGTIGAMYEPGNSDMLVKKTIELLNQNLQQESQKVLHHFQKHFSFSALAQKMIAIYHELIMAYE